MESIKERYLRQAATRRAVSYWFGFGGVGACLVTLAVWYLIRIATNQEVFPKGKFLGIPTEMLVVIVAAVVFIIIAVLFRVASCRPARLARELDDEGTAETPTEEISDGETPLELAEEPDVLAELAPDAEAIAEEPAPDDEIVEEAPAEGSEPAAPAPGLIASARTAILEKAEKTLSDENYERVKKADETIGRGVEFIRKEAKVLAPVAIAFFAIGAAITGSAYKSRIAREHARNRRDLYRWLK